MLIKIDFIRFGLVGAMGFLVSEMGIFLMHGHLNSLPPEPHLANFWGYLVGNEAGLLSNFFWHETWTYNHLDHKYKTLGQKFRHFHLSSWSGVVIILAVDLLFGHMFHTSPYISQVAGSAVGMFWNFFWTRYYIFRGKSPSVLLNPEATVPEREG